MTDTAALVPTVTKTVPAATKIPPLVRPTWPGKGRPPEAIAKQLREDKIAYYKSRRVEIAKIKNETKSEEFFEELIRNGGNATDAAWKVYNCKSRKVASVMGSQQMQKLRGEGLARAFMDSQGANYGKLMKKAIEKMENADKPDWWDRLMKMGGYEDFFAKPEKAVRIGPTNVINVIGQTQKDIASEFIEGEIVDEETSEN